MVCFSQNFNILDIFRYFITRHCCYGISFGKTVETIFFCINIFPDRCIMAFPSTEVHILLNWQSNSAIVFLCVAVGSFLYKRARMEGARPGSFMVVQAFFFLSVVLLVAFLSGDYRFDNPYLGLGIIAGALGMTGAFSKQARASRPRTSCCPTSTKDCGIATAYKCISPLRAKSV